MLGAGLGGFHASEGSLKLKPPGPPALATLGEVSRKLLTHQIPLSFPPLPPLGQGYSDKART